MSKTASGLSKSVLKAVPVADGVAKWEADGQRIFTTINRSAWDLGDWWAFGEAQGYGERKAIAERIGFEFQTCANAASVARAFATSRRREVLSWSHHAEVAALPESEQDRWLDKAEKGHWSRKDLREAVRAARLPGAPPALPAGTFDVILADPPWQYDFAETDNRKIENQYPTMDVDAIAAVELPAAPDAVLFCWATAPKLREALVVIDAWGFDYKTNLVWVKDKIGMGYWARGRHEHLLVATRGAPGVPEPADRPDSVIEAPRTEHSRKPAAVYDLIETALPDRRYLEVFQRGVKRHGWTTWGNE